MDFIHLGILDIIDIFLLALILFQLYRLTKGTNALSIFIGILIVYVLWIVVRALNMELLSLILGQVIGVGVIALIIVFQQEIRRFLLLLGSKYSGGRGNFFKRLFVAEESREEIQRLWIDQLVEACSDMSMTNTGALIVIGRQNDVDQFAETGQKIDSIVSSDLLRNIFFKNTPLHDGAVIIKNDRLYAARCILPSTDRNDIPSYLGTRHRAAIGVSELADVIVVVVSEETGSISLVEGGEVNRGLSASDLRYKLVNKLVK